MKRKVHSAKRNLDWTVRLVWTPEPIRPIGPRQIYSGSVGTGHGAAGVGRMSWGSGFGVSAMPFSFLIFLILVIPTTLVVLPLRFAGVMSWKVEAVTYPGGRRKGPSLVKTWRVRGRRDELQKVVNEIAAALERGDDTRRSRAPYPTTTEALADLAQAEKRSLTAVARWSGTDL